MTDALCADMFSNLDLPLPMPPVNRLDFFPQFDPSTFIAQDVPDSASSGSDNEPISPQMLVPSPLPAMPIFPAFSTPIKIDNLPSNMKETSPTAKGTKRKGAASDPVTLPGTVVKELLKSQEEKKSRLARKAELARQSRRKKKMRMGDLEKEVADLQAELAQAKEEIKRLAVKNSSLSCSPKIANPAQLIDDILKCKATIPSKLKKADREKTPAELKLDHLVSEMMLSIKKENASIDLHLQSLQQSLVPNMAVQFLEWTLTRGEPFYSETTQFGHLFSETMQSAPQQIQSLLQLRKDFKEDLKLKDAKVSEAFEIVKKVFAIRAQQTETFEKLRSIFTPQQLATYMQYVKQFGHVLVKVPT